MLAEEKVNPIYGLIRKSSLESIQRWSTVFSTFLLQLSKIEDPFTTPVSIPKSVEQTLQEMGLFSSLGKYETFGEQVAFINQVRNIVDAYLANKTSQTPLSDDELKKAIGLWFYYQSPPSLLPI